MNIFRSFMAAVLAAPVVGCVSLASAVAVPDASAPGEDLTLWYEKPAAKWNESLPLGNGRLGAMVFGDSAKERLQLNEESLWAGCPVESWPADFPKHLAEVRRLLFAGPIRVQRRP